MTTNEILIERLTQENERLSQENERLTQENERLSQENQRLAQANDTLKRRAAQQVQDHRTAAQLLRQAVSEMRLSRRTENLLRIHGFVTLSDIVYGGRERLKEIPYFGSKCIFEIDKYLDSHSLSWNMDVESILNSQEA